MMLSRSSWVSGAAAAGSGIFVFALVVGLLDQILPTLPRVSLSLAGIPGILAGIGSAYGVWQVVQMGLQSASWSDFRESLVATLSPFDPADHGGEPRQPKGDPRPWQVAQEIRQTQLRHQKILDRIKQRVKAEIQTCERAQAQLRSEQQRSRVLQAQAQQLQQHLQNLQTSSPSPSSESTKPAPEQALRQKLRQLQSQVTTLKIELERQRTQLQHAEAERAQLQQQQQKLKRILQRKKLENRELRSQQAEWARQLEQTQQELQTLRESYRALQVLQEISSTLTQNPSHERAETESSGSSD
ncbi:regulator of replication initiation timing [Thermostichus sp. MS-CIW-23]